MTFYVYSLTDPRNGEVFYIGKGKGLRMYQHALEARRPNAKSNRRKLERIRSIQSEGLEPQADVIAEHHDEQDAFDHEADLIASMPNLTNIMAGGGGRAMTPEEAKRRQKERNAAWFEREKVKLRDRLKVWDAWEAQGLVVTFPGMKAGDEQAAEYVRLVREMLAA